MLPDHLMGGGAADGLAKGEAGCTPASPGGTAHRGLPVDPNSRWLLICQETSRCCPCATVRWYRMTILLEFHECVSSMSLAAGRALALDQRHVGQFGNVFPSDEV